jgi:hypothetical protein
MTPSSASGRKESAGCALANSSPVSKTCRKQQQQQQQLQHK